MVLASYEDASGAPMAALRLASGLRRRGHAVSAYFLYTRSRIDTPDSAFEVIHVKGRPGGFAYLTIPWRVVRTVRDFRPDVVVTYMPLATTVGQVSALLAGVRKRVVSHRSPVDSYTRSMQRLDAAMARLGVYTDFVPVSEAVRLSCRHYPSSLRDRSVVIYNGLLDWRASSLTKAEARRRLGLSENGFVLVSVGRIEEQKNHLFLPPIMAKLAGATLVIAGDGSLRPELERAIEEHGVADRVRLLGTVPRTSVPDILRAADLFVQPSLYEGHSNALLEALNADLPVVASDILEQREVLKGPDGEIAGEVLPLTDPDAWVAVIERFRRDPQLLEEARQIGRRRADSFSFERMIAGYEAIFSRT
jgi:glycosyltransferase involved in cell wall biosynthesis